MRVQCLQCVGGEEGAPEERGALTAGEAFRRSTGDYEQVTIF
jgi:hypothetical protein